MKPLSLRHITALAAASLLASSQFAGTAKQTRRADPDKEKADYLYLEAQRHYAADSLDAYFELMSEANRLNPSDLYIANEVGFFNIAIDHNDSANVAENISHMMRYIESNPKDQTAASRFIRVASATGRSGDALHVLRLIYENAGNPALFGGNYASALSYTNNPDSIRKAITVMENVESIQGADINTTIAKMNMYLNLDDTASVFTSGRKLLEASPDRIENITFMGDVNMQLNRPDSALVYYNRAVEKDPSSGLAYYSRAQYYKQIGDSAAYDREVFTAMKHPDLDLEPKIEILRSYVSELYSDSTQSGRIRELFNSLVDQYPHEEELRNLYGSYLWIVQDLDDAAEQFSYMLDLNPDNKQSWIALSQIYYTLDDYDNATSTAKAALKYFPDDYDFYALLTTLSMLNGDYDKSMEYIDKSLSLTDSTDTEQLASIYGARADIEYRQGDFDKMTADYRKAIELNPEGSVYYNNLAYYMACEDRDLDKALEYITTALSIEKANTGENSATTLDTYAWILFMRKDYPQALEAIEQVLELGTIEKDADVFKHAGDIYFMNGNPDDALLYWKKALDLEPDDELLQRKVKNKTFFFK